MNDKVINKDFPKHSAATPDQKLALPGQLMRLISLLLIAILVGAFCYFVYSDFFGETQAAQPEIDVVEVLPTDADTVILDSTEINSVSAPVEINNPNGENVELTAITACISQEIIDEAEHPLDPLLEMAQLGVDVVTKNVRDYEATIVKRVRWNGRLQGEEFVRCKIRHAYHDPSDPENTVPFSVYTCFLKPKKGQEAIWMKGVRDNKIVAHGPPGLLNVLTLKLDPDSNMAMRGNRYTIESIGMLNLLKKMIDKGIHDRQHGTCEVKLTRNVRVGTATCTRFEIIHPKKTKHFDYHKAEIYIDDERNLPIAYRGYDFPDEPGGRPKLIERYFYKDISLNIGLTDEDFDPANEKYKFPGY